MLYLGTLNKELRICAYDSHGNPIGEQSGCYNLVPVFDWIRRSIVSIFMVFFIAFLPLFLQGSSSLVGNSPKIYVLIHLCRAFRTRDGECIASTSEAFPVIISNIRSVFDPDLHQLHSLQPDIWWCSIYRHRARFRYYQDILRHPLFPFRRAQHIHGHAYPPHATLCHDGALAASLDLLLGVRHGALYRSFHVQPTSVLNHRLYHRL